MPSICVHCGSQSKKMEYDRDRGSYPVCMMCGREKFKERTVNPVVRENRTTESANDDAQVSLFDTIGKLVYPGEEKEDDRSSINDQFAKFRKLPKETIIRKYYKRTGEPRPENRGGSEHKEENKDKPHPVCKVKDCDKWPVRDGLCTHHWSTEYRVGIQKGVAVAVPLKKEEKPMAVKKGRKACTNHPEKYAVSGGLCCACIREKNGKSYRSMKKQTPEAIRIMAVREAEAMEPNRTEADLYRLSKKYHVSITTLKLWIKKHETKTAIDETKAPASEPKLVESETERFEKEMTVVKDETNNIAEVLLLEISKRESEIRALKIALDILRKEAA